MKVLVVGSGAREHALVWKISQSPLVSKIYCAPGNAGTGKHAENVNYSESSLDKLTVFARENKIDITVIGSESPLVNGIVDKFQANGLKCFGPGSKAALLEGSKAYSKRFMQKHNIPTANSAIFTDISNLIQYLKTADYPLVFKADGLAAGKGVKIARNKREAETFAELYMKDEIFGKAGKTVLLENHFAGEELSLITLCDGQKIIPVCVAKDYKQALTGNKGSNTGGMGAIYHSKMIDDANYQKIMETIVKNTEKGLIAENILYKGILYFGIIITKNGPKLLEYNVRFGDPETQVILPILKGDLLQIIIDCINGNLTPAMMGFEDSASVGVVVAAEGYPDNYKKGIPLPWGIFSEDLLLFHANTRLGINSIVNAGGRTLTFVATAENIKEAQAKIYDVLRKYDFKDFYYRTDIGG